jgi:hypothetical protein
MGFIVTKGGGLQETGAKKVPLAFTKDNLIKLLDGILNDVSIYTHQDFCNWAREFHIYCINLFDKHEFVDHKLENLVCDIDTQWDLFLFNTYKTKELLSLDLSNIKLPNDLLQEWWKALQTD